MKHSAINSFRGNTKNHLFKKGSHSLGRWKEGEGRRRRERGKTTAGALSIDQLMISRLPGAAHYFHSLVLESEYFNEVYTCHRQQKETMQIDKCKMTGSVTVAAQANAKSIFFCVDFSNLSFSSSTIRCSSAISLWQINIKK